MGAHVVIVMVIIHHHSFARLFVAHVQDSTTNARERNHGGRWTVDDRGL